MVTCKYSILLSKLYLHSLITSKYLLKWFSIYSVFQIFNNIYGKISLNLCITYDVPHNLWRVVKSLGKVC